MYTDVYVILCTVSAVIMRLAEPAVELPFRPPSDTAFGGLPALSDLLPQSLSWRGLLVEWLSDGPGSGAEMLAARCGREIGDGRAWAVIDNRQEFFPAAFCAGEDHRPSPIAVRPSSSQDTFWAVEQCLRCPGIGLTWCRIERAPPLVLRRWKLAVETGGGIGMLFRPLADRNQPSWADVRWQVTPEPGSALGRRWQIELLYCRGGFGGGAVTLEQQHATGAVRMVPELADSTVATRSARIAGATARAVC
jgi:protein ImuA